MKNGTVLLPSTLQAYSGVVTLVEVEVISPLPITLNSFGPPGWPIYSMISQSNLNVYVAAASRSKVNWVVDVILPVTVFSTAAISELITESVGTPITDVEVIRRKARSTEPSGVGILTVILVEDMVTVPRWTLKSAISASPS